MTATETRCACGRALYCKGLCRRCYLRQWKAINGRPKPREGVCSHPGCEKVKRRWGPYCAMHAGRLYRGEPMDAPEGAWPRLQDAARRWVRAIDCGWSEKGIRAAEERFKRAAVAFRRASRRNAVATRGKPLSAVVNECPEATGSQSERSVA